MACVNIYIQFNSLVFHKPPPWYWDSIQKFVLNWFTYNDLCFFNLFAFVLKSFPIILNEKKRPQIWLATKWDAVNIKPEMNIVKLEEILITRSGTYQIPRQTGILNIYMYNIVNLFLILPTATRIYYELDANNSSGIVGFSVRNQRFQWLYMIWLPTNKISSNNLLGGWMLGWFCYWWVVTFVG